jgi:hypothetical protein
METGIVAGMLFLWTLFIGLAVFLYRGFHNANGSEERYVRVEVDPEQYPLKVKDKA